MLQLSLSGKFLPFSHSQHIHWKVSESFDSTFKVTFCSYCCIFGQFNTTSSAAEFLYFPWLFLRITSEILVQTAVNCSSWADAQSGLWSPQDPRYYACHSGKTIWLVGYLCSGFSFYLFFLLLVPCLTLAFPDVCPNECFRPPFPYYLPSTLSRRFLFLVSPFCSVKGGSRIRLMKTAKSCRCCWEIHNFIINFWSKQWSSGYFM